MQPKSQILTTLGVCVLLTLLQSCMVSTRSFTAGFDIVLSFGHLFSNVYSSLYCLCTYRQVQLLMLSADRMP